MATPPLDPALAREAHEAFAKFGNKKDAADALGLAYSTFCARLNRYVDPGLGAAMAAVGTGMVPSMAWLKTKATDEAPGYSVLLKPPALPDDTLDRIREAFESMAPAEPVIPPEHVLDDMCNVFPLFDVHFGMLAWGAETGRDYDLKSAAGDMKRAFEAVLQLTPHAAHAVLIVGGDFFHADDTRSETPKNKHKLDVDGRYHKVLDAAVEVMGYVIGRIQSRHRHTTIRVLRGNHDEHSHHVLRVGLSQRFRRDASVTVDNSPRDLFEFQWGRSAIFAHHGDKSNATDFVLKVSGECGFWSSCPHRYAYTGHRHKWASERIGTLYWESLDAFAPPDAYGATWANRRALKADTYHKQNGRVLTAHDPIERI